MRKYIDAEKLYKKTAELEAEAMEEVLKHDPKESSDEHISWLYWNAILKERTAFKHDVADAPTADVRENVRGKWLKPDSDGNCPCSKCGHKWAIEIIVNRKMNFCPYCGADMRKERE